VIAKKLCDRFPRRLIVVDDQNVKGLHLAAPPPTKALYNARSIQRDDICRSLCDATFHDA
jgi:hypothetical protein